MRVGSYADQIVLPDKPRQSEEDMVAEMESVAEIEQQLQLSEAAETSSAANAEYRLEPDPDTVRQWGVADVRDGNSSEPTQTGWDRLREAQSSLTLMLQEPTIPDIGDRAHATSTPPSSPQTRGGFVRVPSSRVAHCRA